MLYGVYPQVVKVDYFQYIINLNGKIRKWNQWKATMQFNSSGMPATFHSYFGRQQQYGKMKQKAIRLCIIYVFDVVVVSLARSTIKQFVVSLATAHTYQNEKYQWNDIHIEYIIFFYSGKSLSFDKNRNNLHRIPKSKVIEVMRGLGQHTRLGTC